MSRARLVLLVTLVLFVGWLGWLLYAVLNKDAAPVVSRAQLTAATHLIVVEVTLGDDGLPKPMAKVVEALRGDGVTVGSDVEIQNLPSAMPPGADSFPGAGAYLLPVTGDGTTFRIAGLPRSPGYEPTAPPRPMVYPWNDKMRAQLKGLGLVK